MRVTWVLRADTAAKSAKSIFFLFMAWVHLTNSMLRIDGLRKT